MDCCGTEGEGLVWQEALRDPEGGETEGGEELAEGQVGETLLVC